MFLLDFMWVMSGIVSAYSIFKFINEKITKKESSFFLMAGSRTLFPLYLPLGIFVGISIFVRLGYLEGVLL
jgi:hypothetical protein